MSELPHEKLVNIRVRAGGPSVANAGTPRSWVHDVAGHILFALVVAAVSALLAWKVVPGVLRGELIEPDNYMRLLRVERLVETREWYSNIIPRSNYPCGETLHWTRPVDVALLALSLPLQMFSSFPEALHLAGVFFGPLTLIFICFAVGWAVIPIASRKVRYLAMIAVLAQPGVVGYALPGRPDHHPLLLLTFVLSLGLGIRWVNEPFKRSWAAATGASVGFGIWLSTEYLLPLAVFLATGFVLWIRERGEWARKNLWFSLGLIGLLAAALALEHPPWGLLAAEYDRISAPHVLVGILGLGFWAGTFAAEERGSVLRTWRGRLGWGVGGGALAFSVLFLSYPPFFRGPEADIDPALWPVWRDLIQETQPLLPRLDPGSVGTAIAYLGPVGFVAPFLLWVLFQEWSSQRRGGWLLLLLSLGVLAPVALRFARFVTYPEVLLVMVIAVLISRAQGKIGGSRRSVLSTLKRSLVSAALIVGCLWLGAILSLAAGSSGSQIRAAESELAAACPLSKMARFLGDPAGLGDRPRTVLAHLDYGPEILYRSEHRVLGTPYQRNARGILDSFSIFSSHDPTEARRIAESRGVDLVLVCPQHSWIYSGTDRPPDSRSLHELLSAGEPPDWLVKIPVPEESSGEFLLYRVRE